MKTQDSPESWGGKNNHKENAGNDGDAKYEPPRLRSGAETGKKGRAKVGKRKKTTKGSGDEGLKRGVSAKSAQKGAGKGCPIKGQGTGKDPSRGPGKRRVKNHHKENAIFGGGTWWKSPGWGGGLDPTKRKGHEKGQRGRKKNQQHKRRRGGKKRNVDGKGGRQTKNTKPGGKDK